MTALLEVRQRMDGTFTNEGLHSLIIHSQTTIIVLKAAKGVAEQAIICPVKIHSWAASCLPISSRTSHV